MIYDNAGFSIVQWSTSSNKIKLLNKCKGKIGDLICQLNFLREDLNKNYVILDEILKTCIDLKYCTRQFYLIYNNNLKNKENEKQDLRYLYAKEYNKTLSKKCNSNQFLVFVIKNVIIFPLYQIIVDLHYWIHLKIIHIMYAVLTQLNLDAIKVFIRG